MNEYVKDLMLQIEEKNMNIKLLINSECSCSNVKAKRLTRELDCLLYEFYKSVIYYVPVGRS